MSMEASGTPHGEPGFGQAHDIIASKELPREMFETWWSMLAEEDRSEFRYFYQGDEILARFVCVLDYLLMQKVQGDRENLFALAYHIACKPFPEFAVSMDNPGIRPRAARAWKHPAVQALMDRVKSRATRHKIIRISNLIARNVEDMLEESNRLYHVRDENNQPKYDEMGEPVMAPMYEMKDRKFAVDAANKMLEIMSNEERFARIDRTKLGLENARKALSEREEEVDPKVLKSYAQLALKSGLLTKAEVDAALEK